MTPLPQEGQEGRYSIVSSQANTTRRFEITGGRNRARSPRKCRVAGTEWRVRSACTSLRQRVPRRCAVVCACRAAASTAAGASNEKRDSRRKMYISDRPFKPSHADSGFAIWWTLSSRDAWATSRAAPAVPRTPLDTPVIHLIRSSHGGHALTPVAHPTPVCNLNPTRDYFSVLARHPPSRLLVFSSSLNRRARAPRSSPLVRSLVCAKRRHIWLPPLARPRRATRTRRARRARSRRRHSASTSTPSAGAFTRSLQSST